jgi:hypothetical protein
MPAISLSANVAMQAVSPKDPSSVAVASKALQQEKQDGDNSLRLIASTVAPGNGKLVNTQI